MRTLRACLLIAAVLGAVSAGPGAAPTRAHAQSRPITVDDLMTLSTINDVEIAPDGSRVAYTVSTPSLETNVHETTLFVVPKSMA